MTDYMLTVLSASGAATDVRVNAADSIHHAIRLAEKETGCRVNHGRSGVGAAFDPALTIAAPTGNVIRHHRRAARIEVAMGPPEVMAAIKAAMTPRPVAPPKRKTGGGRDAAG